MSRDTQACSAEGRRLLTHSEIMGPTLDSATEQTTPQRRGRGHNQPSSPHLPRGPVEVLGFRDSEQLSGERDSSGCNAGCVHRYCLSTHPWDFVLTPWATGSIERNGMSATWDCNPEGRVELPVIGSWGRAARRGGEAATHFPSGSTGLWRR